ncbi:alpha/beta fold hydrolase [Actinoplanes sp. NPDC049265]|uniref:alpha/beta fold hydrolase n=1 Tax=Actinoplanes sp. NPDC049265 TaxID=3363902 RepID=UPI003716E525
MSLIRRLAVAGLAATLLAGPLSTPADAAATLPAGPLSTPADVAAARTSAREKHRVDAVRTPKLKWYKCYVYAECATATVPLDYDRPGGAKTEIALVRLRATDRKHRVGSLFVNPGGPGGSATQFALLSPLFLSDKLLARFDIVGMDPRGVGFSDNVTCFDSPRQQANALKGMTPRFPYGKKEEKAYVASAVRLGRACSTTGRPLTGAMSTAEVARDMDVMRRAVGDKRLNYLGFSYGSVLGSYYANMFPDRFRTIAIDGVINPRAWAGTKQTRNIVQDVRLDSAGGAYRAFAELMNRCAQAGPEKCEFAGGNTLTRFHNITEHLKRNPIVVPVPVLGITVRITYADFIGEVLDALYSPSAGEDVAALAADLQLLQSGATGAGVTAAQTRFADRMRRGFPYDNSLDAYASVMCTDGRHPANASSWPAAAAAADKKAPYFGRAWTWASVPCARDTWTVRDEDAYTGPFNTRTRNPVLVVGSFWDPATNYRDAVQTARKLPNSRLLSSNNWGHTAYGTSACATGAMDTYLLTKRLPAKGTVCTAPQPFTGANLIPGIELSTASVNALVAQGRPAPGAAKQLPPIAGRR